MAAGGHTWPTPRAEADGLSGAHQVPPVDVTPPLYSQLGCSPVPVLPPQTLHCPRFALGSCLSRGEADVSSPQTCSRGHFKSLLSVYPLEKYTVHPKASGPLWQGSMEGPGSRSQSLPRGPAVSGAPDARTLLAPSPAPLPRPALTGSGNKRKSSISFRPAAETEIRRHLKMTTPWTLLSQVDAPGQPQAPELRDTGSVPLPRPDPAPLPSRPSPPPGPG